MSNRSRAMLILALLGAACSADSSEPQPASDVIAVTGAMIIDGLDGDPIPDGIVLVDGERIAAVGPADAVTIPDGARLVDAGGGAVLPGLADMHVHLVGGWDGVSTDMLGYQRYLNALLYSGVTTVLDVGNVLPFVQQIRAEVNAGRLAGPRIYMVGPLVDGPEPIWPPLSYAADDEATLRAYVEQLSAAGVDAIKGYAGLNEGMIAALVSIAREYSLPVIVDVRAQAAAVRAGVAGLAHSPGGAWTDEDVAAMVERDTAVITTLTVTESFSRRRLGDLTFLDNALIALTTPPWFLDDLTTEADRDLSDAQAERAARVAERLAVAMGNVARMHAAGVTVVTGTDAPYPGVFQGEGVHRELELLVEDGLSPLEAIRAATHNAAKLMGADHEWGSIAAGMVADLLIVRGNPAENVGASRDIIAVIQRGRLLDRRALELDVAADPGFRTTGSVAAE